MLIRVTDVFTVTVTVVILLVGAGISNHTEEEIQEANQRNRAVSSSAIQRAMTDANSGQYSL